MKQITILSILASTMLIYSCTKDNEDLHNNDDSQIITFAVSSEDAQTRTKLIDLGTREPKMRWQTGDALSVWATHTGDIHRKFTINSDYKDDDAKNFALFSGQAIDNATKYYVLYPYSANSKFDGSSTISSVIPPNQAPTNGSFDRLAALMGGATSGAADKSLTLYHLCAYLKITTTGNSCKSIKVQSNDPAWHFTGKVRFEPSSSGSKITSFGESTEEYDYVEINPIGNIAPGTYVMAIIPTTGAPSFTVTITDVNGKTLSKTQPAGKALSTGTIYNLGTVNIPASN